jgi:hypothetical protein
MKAIAIAAVLIAVCSACSDTTQGVRTQFVGSYPFTAAEQRTVTRIAGAAALEARRHLPALASPLTLQVTSGKDGVSPDRGATATVIAPDWIRWTVDPTHPDGVVKIADAHLRGTLFHEFHHLVRHTTGNLGTLMDFVVSEGLATAFERDAAGVTYPWGQYPADVSMWVDELLALPPDANRDQWMFRHPDGRRWIGYKAGTYLADRAMKELGRTSAELVSTPTGEVVAAATRGLYSQK